jgi:single-stranded DNA-binding protein
MSLNQANIILLKTHEGDQGYFGSPDYSADLHELASDIVRVSQYMESGHLAPTTKQRAKAAQAEPEPKQEAQPVAQSRPARPTREEPPTAEHANEDAPADDYGQGPISQGMEDDDIPF